jgi:8-oxo-dGTP diphosphatase
MPKILKTSGQEIDQALRNATRQYLVGDLQKPQALQHVPSSLIEVGITRYENEGKLEPPHRHKQAFEFQYVTAGLTAYLDLGTAEEHVFRKGDFYMIEPGVAYAQKSAPGTEILFIKCRRETIRCRWILLLKLRGGFENQSKNRTAGNGTTRLLL